MNDINALGILFVLLMVWIFWLNLIVNRIQGELKQLEKDILNLIGHIDYLQKTRLDLTKGNDEIPIGLQDTGVMRHPITSAAWYPDND